MIRNVYWNSVIKLFSKLINRILRDALLLQTQIFSSFAENTIDTEFLCWLFCICMSPVWRKLQGVLPLYDRVFSYTIVLSKEFNNVRNSHCDTVNDITAIFLMTTSWYSMCRIIVNICIFVSWNSVLILTKKNNLTWIIIAWHKTVSKQRLLLPANEVYF